MALKIYGASTEGVVNGSMGFDEKTLQPTYQLQLGCRANRRAWKSPRASGMPEDIMRAHAAP